MDRIINEYSILKNADSVPYVSFKAFEDIDFIRHGFSTRLGGVSSGSFAAMNLGYERGDVRENVTRNFELIAESIGFDYRKVVLTNQWHTTNVRAVGEELLGQGIISPKTTDEIDGQVTNVPGAVLLAYGADCTPVYLVDEENRAIGLCHSGWKGTLNNISYYTVEKMKELYGTDPSKLKAVIGPSICRDCYEVSGDVALSFRDTSGSGDEKRFSCRSFEEIVFPGKAEDKYQLDLWEANRQNLLSSGLLPSNISVSHNCTRCNKELFFSHRRDGQARGAMAAFLTIKER